MCSANACSRASRARPKHRIGDAHLFEAPASSRSLFDCAPPPKIARSPKKHFLLFACRHSGKESPSFFASPITAALTSRPSVMSKPKILVADPISERGVSELSEGGVLDVTV